MSINRKVLFAIVAILGLIILIEGGIFLQNKLEKKKSFAPPSVINKIVQQAPENTNSAPTISPEEIKAIAKAQVHQIKVPSDQTTPVDLTIRQYDQVRWDNQTDREMIVKALDQESPPLGKGKRFLISFKKKGSFAYQVLLDGQEKSTGKITVE